MDIKLATLKDADALLALNTMFENETDRQSLTDSLSNNDREIILIAYENNQPVAFATGLIVKSMCYANPRMDIEALYVKDEYRGQGIGRQLLKSLQAEANTQSIHHFHITVYSNNKIARALYEDEGYEPSGEILLEKTITQ